LKTIDINPLSMVPIPNPAAATGLEILAPVTGSRAEILSPTACDFLAGLMRTFEPRRRELLDRRAERQRELDAGRLPDFLPETASIREGDWRIPPPPPDLADRRIEISGPVDRRTLIAALTSGARSFMADLEDFTSPTWENVVDGQVHLYHAVRRTLRDAGPGGKVYALAEPLATLLVRPRGWHLPEKHVHFNGEPVSAALFDWGLYAFHNARELLARGSGPYCYLPKLESHLEARLWHQVFRHTESALALPAGAIRATAMIETLPAAFEAEEILYELREHASGLNCGRWDYLFSAIKSLGRRGAIYPERAQLAMTAPFLRAYCRHIVRVCHRRGAHALGGMAAQVPVAGDPEAHAAALRLVRGDKEREAADGFDGTSVGHPALVPIAFEAFGWSMEEPHRLDRGRDEGPVTQAELLAAPGGTISEEGVRLNLRVGVRYVEAWLGGLGCVVLDRRIEDAATAEISRALLWQWLHRDARLVDGRPITAELYRRLLARELAGMEKEIGAERFRAGRFVQASGLFLGLVEAAQPAAFFTLPAYELLP
jgi:malate synthase